MISASPCSARISWRGYLMPVKPPSQPRSSVMRLATGISPESMEAAPRRRPTAPVAMPSGAGGNAERRPNHRRCGRDDRTGIRPVGNTRGHVQVTENDAHTAKGPATQRHGVGELGHHGGKFLVVGQAWVHPGIAVQCVVRVADLGTATWAAGGRTQRGPHVGGPPVLGAVGVRLHPPWGQLPGGPPTRLSGVLPL